MRGKTKLSIGGVPGFGASWPDRERRADWHQPIQSFNDLRARIDAYDKSTSDLFLESTLPWMARNLAAEVGHQFYNLPKDNPFFQALPKTMAGWVDSKVTYNKIFNIGKEFVPKPVEASWWEFLTNKDAQAYIKETAWDNFKGFSFTPIGIKDYFKHVIGQYNVGAIAEDIRDGRVLPAAAKTFGLGTLLYSVASSTRKAYQQAQQEEDGTIKGKLRTWGKTAWACIKETAKSITTWELGTIGYMLGAGLVCVGPLPRMIAGILVGGLLETGFKSLINGPVHQRPQPVAVPNHLKASSYLQPGGPQIAPPFQLDYLG